MHVRSLISKEIISTMQQIKHALIEKISEIRGAFVEDKGATLSLHYRLVPEDKEILVKKIFDRVCGAYRVKVYKGKKVLEVRPPIEWDKGKVALWFLRKQEIMLGQGNIYLFISETMPLMKMHLKL